MAPLILLAALFFQAVAAQNAPYGQCGGTSGGLPWTGSTACCPSYSCQYISDTWWGCQETPAPAGTVARWGTCGGSGYTGSTICQPGTSCIYYSPTWSRCETDSCPPLAVPTFSSTNQLILSTTTKKSTSSPAKSSSTSKTSSSTKASSTLSSVTSSTLLNSSSRYTSSKSSSIRFPSTSSSKSVSPSISSTSKVVSFSSSIFTISSVKRSTSLSTRVTTFKSTSSITSATSTTTTSLSCATQNSPPPSAGKVSLSGINIAGCEFPGNSNAYNPPSGSYCPTGMNGWPDGPGQMAHFVDDDKFNTFRLPVSWQFLINSQTASSTLDPTNWAVYDFMVQKCLITGAYCLVEVHNFARFEGNIIGQGGPANSVFAALWAAIATKYAGNSKVIFGLMNEPHEVDINLWAGTCQAAVTAIRAVETLQHIILLPGNNYASAGTFLNDGSATALSTVTNPDGSFTNLVFDVHKYLDANNAGNTNECPYDYISSAFAPLAQWLRCHGRKAFLTEIGGGNTDSCHTNLCSVIAFLNANSDVYLGYLGWAAGSFDTYHTITETPWGGPGTWSDQGYEIYGCPC